MVKGKSTEEIRKLFNIVNDFTPEEEVMNSVLLFGHDDWLTHRIIGSDQEGECESLALSDTHVVSNFSWFAFCVRNGRRIVNYSEVEMSTLRLGLSLPFSVSRDLQTWHPPAHTFHWTDERIAVHVSPTFHMAPVLVLIQLDTVWSTVDRMRPTTLLWWDQVSYGCLSAWVSFVTTWILVYLRSESSWHRDSFKLLQHYTTGNKG